MQKSRFASLISFTALALLATSFASGYVLLNPPRRWFPTDTPRLVTVDQGGMASVTVPDRGVSASVAAVEWWNSGGVNVTDGQAGSVAYQLGDARSDLIFSDPLHICTGNCLAATTTGFYDTGQTGSCDGLQVVAITDSDIAFNTRFDYTTPGEPDGCSSEIYLDSVVAHEVGHVIGLGHSNNSSALMYASVAYCSHKIITGDDTAGRDALYDCTTFTSGGGGNCTLKQAGELCSSNAECCSNKCTGKPGAKTCK